MSADSVAAKRYAKALYEAAAQQDLVWDVEQQLKALVDALEQTPEFKAFLGSPNIETSRKISVLEEALAGKTSDLLTRFIRLLIERGRQADLPGVYRAYARIAGDASGQARAIVYTAKPLGEAELAAIAEQFGKVTGKTIRAEQEVDPSLIGGVMVRIGDRLYDGSLSGKLARLEKALIS
ncbi:MAG: F0F1 ATP synthase subunit delta [Thermobacillus sp.]|uniref:ATP synthase subunit delta n=1 Tax=Thermobacillus composti (strain DSM 18247 / JCM 13945 / KWC4) TaxID=717605 RepID=L0EI07_THECK|nr:MULTISPECIES: F0F1 ATP synthase subunit delta [Thermobacillus]AGA59873.1 ATP synthase, F1 delta subunit [Thermobacillus composti KWC4]REK55462.1 MAG: F0F1 ATP synthase subunit delta [Thermobacillus sp.]